MKKIPSSITLINKFRNFIIQLNFLLTKKKILIAFSGGQDSVCLTVLIIQLIYQFNLYFGIVYCNHLWNLNSLYKFCHVSKIGFTINKNFFFIFITKKKFTEKSARTWRYSIIYRVSQFYNYEIVLAGHTKTDQIETLLLNLFRSSSKDGISIFTSDHFIINKSTKEIFLSEQGLNG